MVRFGVFKIRVYSEIHTPIWLVAPKWLGWRCSLENRRIFLSIFPFGKTRKESPDVGLGDPKFSRYGA